MTTYFRKGESIIVELYHGSNVEVQYPEIRKAKFTKDFSWGFYCTNSYKQACRWAKQRGRNHQGIISVYEYEATPNLNIKIFPEMSDEWLDFIANCRAGSVHGQDVVEGPMADDTIWNYVNDFVAGVISRQAFWELAKFKHPTHQISFHTLRAIDCLRYVRSDVI